MGRRITRAGKLGRNKTPPDERAGGGDPDWRGSRLDANHVRGVQPFVASLHLELHYLPFSERLEAVHLDGREVHEHVLAAVLMDGFKTLAEGQVVERGAGWRQRVA